MYSAGGISEGAQSLDKTNDLVCFHYKPWFTVNVYCLLFRRT